MLFNHSKYLGMHGVVFAPLNLTKRSVDFDLNMGRYRTTGKILIQTSDKLLKLKNQTKVRLTSLLQGVYGPG